MGLGGDGFYSRIDPVGTGTSLRYWSGNNSGGSCALHRPTNCLAGGPGTQRRGGWTGDTQSFILPFDLFHGGIAGGDDCGAAARPAAAAPRSPARPASGRRSRARTRRTGSTGTSRTTRRRRT
jgi:hypothetical protein